jgi:hypothetical protein
MKKSKTAGWPKLNVPHHPTDAQLLAGLRAVEKVTGAVTQMKAAYYAMIENSPAAIAAALKEKS